MGKNCSSIPLLLLAAVLAARPLLASSVDAIPPKWTAKVHKPQRIILSPDSLLLASNGLPCAANESTPRSWRHQHAVAKPTKLSHKDKYNWNVYNLYRDFGFLQNRSSQYKIIRELGSGTFGRVWKARDLHAIDTKDEYVAIKCSYNIQDTLRENISLRDASLSRHANIARHIASFGFVQLRNPYNTSSGRPVACIVQELIKGKTLQDALYDMVGDDLVNAKISGDFVRRIFRQILQALKHIHGIGMVHRDLKSNNFMLEEETERLVLIDFGFATYALNPLLKRFYPNVWRLDRHYQPGFDPELRPPSIDSSDAVLLQDDADQFAFDLYAAGTTLRELFTAEIACIVGWRELLQGDELKAMNQWAKELFGENAQAWKLYRATRQPSATRITLDGMLQHPFMTQGESSTLPGHLTSDAPPRPVQQVGRHTDGSAGRSDSPHRQTPGSLNVVQQISHEIASNLLKMHEPVGVGGPYFKRRVKIKPSLANSQPTASSL